MERRQRKSTAAFSGTRLAPDQKLQPADFKAFLLSMPDVGEDSDFSRSGEQMRDWPRTVATGEAAEEPADAEPVEASFSFSFAPKGRRMFDSDSETSRERTVPSGQNRGPTSTSTGCAPSASRLTPLHP
jgi:hypothetical protein